jgi:hypothetical protein
MILHVLKHPNARTLAHCIEAADGAQPPQGFEAMTIEEFQAWQAPFVPVHDDGKPAVNPATHKVVDDGIIVETTRRRRSWLVVPLTTAEIDERTDASDAEQLRQVYTALKNHTGTSANRMDRVENVCAFLLKQEAKRRGLSVT